MVKSTTERTDPITVLVSLETEGPLLLFEGELVPEPGE